MPLPHVKRFCAATCRTTGERCKNPAAHGMKTCRYHGARKQGTVRRGEDHPAYKHGQCTNASRVADSEAATRLREIEDFAHRHGILTGTRLAGRKPKG